jgi:hypothetical protein
LRILSGKASQGTAGGWAARGRTVACPKAIESNGQALTDTIFDDCLTINPLRDWEDSAATLDDGINPA